MKKIIKFILFIIILFAIQTYSQDKFLIKEETIVLNKGNQTEFDHQHLWFYKPNIDSIKNISERICERCYRYEKIVTLYSSDFELANKKWNSLIEESKLKSKLRQ
jgi:hypothetical protein